jgi:hypothetical protein
MQVVAQRGAGGEADLPGDLGGCQGQWIPGATCPGDALDEPRPGLMPTSSPERRTKVRRLTRA